VSGIARAQLIRDEVKKTGEVLTTVVEDSVPYQFTNNGATTWGFNVSRNGSALAVNLSRLWTRAFQRRTRLIRLRLEFRPPAPTQIHLS
jgi:hypothetical protein